MSNVAVSSSSSFNTIFSRSTSLKGMNGTTYDSNHVDKTYARIDTPSTPGYFSIKKVQLPTCTNKTYNTQEQILFEGHSTGDYTNDILKGTNAGNYNATLTLKSNYQWSDGSTDTTKTITCKINPYNISSSSVVPIVDQVYTGEERLPVPSIIVDIPSSTYTTTLSPSDYTAEYSNNINVGMASITIVGVGNYTGTKVTTFNIVETDLSNLDIREETYVILNKNSTKETIIDLVGSNINVLHNGEEIDVTTKISTGDILRVGSKDYEIAILGDANKDGKVNISDLTRTYKIYKGTYEPSKVEWYASNSNGDANINISDLTRTYKIYKNTIN